MRLYMRNDDINFVKDVSKWTHVYRGIATAGYIDFVKTKTSKINDVDIKTGLKEKNT